MRTERRKQEAEQEAAALKEAEGVLGVCCDWGGGGVFFRVRRTPERGEEHPLGDVRLRWRGYGGFIS